MSTTATFTSNFVSRIEQSHETLNEYITSQKSQADTLLTQLQTLSTTEQQSIDTLLSQLNSLQYERGVAAAANSGGGGEGNNNGGSVRGLAEQRQKLESKQLKLEEGVERLRHENRVEQDQLDEILAEETAMRQKADEVKARKEEIETARGITVEDLTKGLLNYKYTGLTFEQCDKGALSFNFTKLDKEEPSKPFKFTLCLDTNQNYQLSNVTPPLDEAKTKVVVDNLNKDGKSGFNSFAVGMRKLFKETLQ